MHFSVRMSFFFSAYRSYDNEKSEQSSKVLSEFIPGKLEHIISLMDFAPSSYSDLNLFIKSVECCLNS